MANVIIRYHIEVLYEYVVSSFLDPSYFRTRMEWVNELKLKVYDRRKLKKFIVNIIKMNLNITIYIVCQKFSFLFPWNNRTLFYYYQFPHCYTMPLICYTTAIESDQSINIAYRCTIITYFKWWEEITDQKSWKSFIKIWLNERKLWTVMVEVIGSSEVKK